MLVCCAFHSGKQLPVNYISTLKNKSPDFDLVGVILACELGESWYSEARCWLYTLSVVAR